MHRRNVLWIIGLLLVYATAALAQEVSAGMTGRVTDPSGAAIVGASVTAKDVDRGTTWSTKSNEDGIYAFPRVPIGHYELKVEAAGFKTFVQSSITLEVNQRARIDAAMQVGGLTETVTITGEAALLQTETTQVGAVITSQTITNTPLVSRNPIALTLLSPGVTSTDPSSFNNGQRTAGGGRPYVNGNRKEANNFLLDGIDNNQTSDNLSSYQPNLEAIQEFKMITNNASAEFGNFQGGIVNVIIKSGTNAFHGSAFEYWRNDKLNANSWSNNWNNVVRTPLRWNQFGGTFGGRLIKDKLFFFADYQGLRRAFPPSITKTIVMPEAWRKGDFSRFLDKSYAGSAIQLYNPLSTDAAGNRAPFVNNQVPVSMFSPVVTKLFANTKLYPLPNVPNSDVSPTTYNYYYSSSSYVRSDQGDFKLDWKPSEKNDFSARYSNGRQDTPSVNTLPFAYNSFAIAPFQNGVINWTRSVSPTLVNEARFGINNILLNNGGEDKGLGNIAADLGIANAGTGLLALQGFTYARALGSANIGTQQLFANTTYHFADNLTIIRGRHMIKTGMQIMRQQMNTYYSGNNGRTGFINFNGRFTVLSAATTGAKQIGEADFLLGLPNQLGRGPTTGTWGQRKTIWGVYFQDDWRATDSLTLNLGLRWEYHTPLVEVKDRQSNFSPFSGALLLAGQNGNSRALYNAFKKDFQPRVGFAYTPDILGKKMVLRGAYTISSFMEGSGTNLRLPMNPPFNTEYLAEYITSAYNLPDTTLADGLSGLNPKDAFKGATLRVWDPGVRPAITQQWNFMTEFQLPKGMVFSTGYVGQHGTHLIVAMPYKQNKIVNGKVVTGDYFSGDLDLRNKISQISGTESNGNQQYHSWQSILRKRMAAGLEFQASYTWSHGMSDSIGFYGEAGLAGPQSAYMQNLYDRKAEWGPTYFDVRHAAVISAVYDLPFGKGKALGANWAAPINMILGGWQLGGIFTTQTGMPLTITAASDASGTGARAYRASVLRKGNNPHEIGPGAKWLEPITSSGPYVGPTNLTFGNAGVGTERAKGMTRGDLSLGKMFPLTEQKYFEFRAEAFNLTNTPIFQAPGRGINSTTYGEIRSAQGDRQIQLSLKFAF